MKPGWHGGLSPRTEPTVLAESEPQSEPSPQVESTVCNPSPRCRLRQCRRIRRALLPIRINDAVSFLQEEPPPGTALEKGRTACFSPEAELPMTKDRAACCSLKAHAVRAFSSFRSGETAKEHPVLHFADGSAHARYASKPVSTPPRSRIARRSSLGSAREKHAADPRHSPARSVRAGLFAPLARRPHRRGRGVIRPCRRPGESACA